MMFILQCPKCNNRMRYHTSAKFLTGKRKKCVYCGFSMSVRESVIKREE